MTLHRPRPAFKRLTAPLLPIVLLTAPPARAFAQAIDLNFPPIAQGYDQQIGVTVQSRPRTLYDALGVRVSGFQIDPVVEQLLAYDSNPTSSTSATPTLKSTTSATLNVASLWSRDSLGGTLGVDHVAYGSLRGADYTDWNLGLRAGYTIVDHELTGAYAHQSYHQLGEAIGTVRSDTPVADATDTGQLGYTFSFGRLDLTPDLSESAYRYGVATASGVRLDQQYLDRNVISGGLTAAYTLTQFGSVLVVGRSTSSHYLHGLQGVPSNDSQNETLLAGLDYQASGPWRYRVLAGLEVTSFSADRYPTRVSPVVEASATWTPTGITTLTGTLRRAISDPLSAGNNGFVLTSANLQVDHELLRNVILQGRTSVQYAQYLQGGGQTQFGIGGSVDWLLARGLRLSLSADLTRESAATGLSTAAGLDTPQSDAVSHAVVGVALSFGL